MTKTDMIKKQGKKQGGTVLALLLALLVPLLFGSLAALQPTENRFWHLGGAAQFTLPTKAYSMS